MYLKKIAGEAPRRPGVYLFRNSENQIIYVGKARILRNRLFSYFSGEKDIKTKILISHTASIETIIVKDEYEALLLENTLIKQHSPKYNISLKDGKTYPVIRVTAGPFPRIFKTRHIINDGSVYYGPFTDAGAIDGMLEVINRVFHLRKCGAFKKRNHPCMYYHIGSCQAPCCNKINAEEYSRLAERARKLLSGDSEAFINELNVEMKEEAAAFRFERAAQIRNAIKTIESLGEYNSVADFDPQGRDYIAWAIEGLLATFTVFSMREGKLAGKDLFNTRSAADEWESLETFITSYYDDVRLPPAQIYLENNITENTNILLNWFNEQFQLKPKLFMASDDRNKAIMAMARQNAAEELRRRLRDQGAALVLDDLKTDLSLKNQPLRIEGFDVSQLGGKFPVASLISFANGMPDKKNYRHFKLRSVIGRVDDYSAIREVIKRRYSRQIRENGELPDLVLVDGGIGQANAAKGILEKLGLDCDIIALAERDDGIWRPGEKKPLYLEPNSETLKLLQYIRNESHRFALALNKKLRSGDLRMEILESVEGIGVRRAEELIKHYHSLGALSAAEIEEIAQICGCAPDAARAVRAASRLALNKRKSQNYPDYGDLARIALTGDKLASEQKSGYE